MSGSPLSSSSSSTPSSSATASVTSTAPKARTTMTTSLLPLPTSSALSAPDEDDDEALLDTMGDEFFSYSQAAAPEPEEQDEEEGKQQEVSDPSSLIAGPSFAFVSHVSSRHDEHQQERRSDSRIISPDQLEMIKMKVYLEATSDPTLQSVAQRLVDHAIAVDQERLASELKHRELEPTIASLQCSVALVDATSVLALSTASVDYQRLEIDLTQSKLQANALFRKLVEGGSIVSESQTRPMEAQHDPGFGVYAISSRGGGYASTARASLSSTTASAQVENMLVKENRLLRSDVQYLNRRLHDSESLSSQNTKDLFRLRAHLLNGTPLIIFDSPSALPSLRVPSVPSISTSLPTPPPIASTSTLPSALAPPTSRPRRKRYPTMGDAEGEHLLLAGKRLYHSCRAPRYPLSLSEALENETANTIAVAGNAAEFERAMSGAQRLAKFDAVKEREREQKRAESEVGNRIGDGTGSSANNHELAPTTPARRSPHQRKPLRSPTGKEGGGRGGRRGGEGGAMPMKSSTDSILVLPGGGFAAMRNLLDAAQTVLEPGTDGQEARATVRIRKRKNGEDGDDDDESGGRVGARMELKIIASDGASREEEHRARSRSRSGTATILGPKRLKPSVVLTSGPRGTTADDYPTSPSLSDARSDLLSALDVLADQATANQPEATSLVVEGANMEDEEADDDGHDDKDDEEDGEYKQTEDEQDLDDGVDEVEVEDQGSTKPTATTTTTELKVRSPYVRWESHEDELLVRAIIMHGQRWDAVARCVPIRSYHQCRQRWLRGLRSGEALPDELVQYQSLVRHAVRDYESLKGGRIAAVSDAEIENDLAS